MVARHQKIDPVSARLRASTDAPLADVLQWLDNQQQRRVMHRRATACTLGGWALVIAAATIGTATSIYMSLQIREIMSGEFGGSTSPVLSPNYTPTILAGITAILLLGGLLTWRLQRVPGFSHTLSAIDWSTASDAVTRLLRAGCTFPDAFRTAAEVSVVRRNREWLIEAARRIESGGPELNEGSTASGDTAIVESLVGALDDRPDRRWKIASDHLFHLAKWRLSLLLQTLPMIATVLSGLIVWMAFASTLGWMWRAVMNLLNQFGKNTFGW